MIFIDISDDYVINFIILFGVFILVKIEVIVFWVFIKMLS